jgi:hypothetical protein
MLQVGRSRVRFPMSLEFFNSPNPSSRTMALGSTQPLTEMSTRNLPAGKGRPARKANNLIAIYEPIFERIGELRRLITLWSSTACYRDSFTFFTRIQSSSAEDHTAAFSKPCEQGPDYRNLSLKLNSID